MSFKRLQDRYNGVKYGGEAKKTFAMDILVNDQKGILKNITSLVYKYGGNFIYLQSYLGFDNQSHIELEIEGLSDSKKLKAELDSELITLEDKLQELQSRL